MNKKFLILSLFIALALIGPAKTFANTYESQTSNDDWSTVDTSTAKKGQGFVAESTHTVTSVKIKVFIEGTPGTATLSLYHDNSGVPGTLMTSGTFNANSLTTSNTGQIVDVTMDSEETVTSGQTYIIVLSDSSASSGNDIAWNGLGDSGFTPTSIQSSNNGISWGSLQPDAFYFEIDGNAVGGGGGGGDPPPPTSDFGLGFVSVNETHFASTTGFTASSLVGWTGSTLIKPFMGSGLAVLYYLRYWILVLIIMAIIIFFSYKAFKLYKK